MWRSRFSSLKMWLYKKKNDPSPYSELEPHHSAYPNTDCSNSYGPRTFEESPVLADPRDSLLRVLQVDHLPDSAARVFDLSLRLPFTTFQSRYKNRPTTGDRQLGSNKPEGYIRTSIRHVDGHYLVHTYLRFWATSPARLYDNVRRNRYAEAAHGPCPHVFLENSWGRGVVLPCTRSGCFRSVVQGRYGANDAAGEELGGEVGYTGG
ncbi:hypothetical protein K461DRAFT_94107 [Myriangium duriaei CBS 260.36]|uniref:Uncharacterized protein n=1 Tax=Myriangium duriaei CBS 260.36 TaxID=1168546 RepID=A0A9P4MNJ9_9PEZI|nr:hypothetical protein K461DRAFT_94107 [Myriangium duriaei CBS 260.36]